VRHAKQTQGESLLGPSDITLMMLFLVGKEKCADDDKTLMVKHHF
jgi:hypothetical protein